MAVSVPCRETVGHPLVCLKKEGEITYNPLSDVQEDRPESSQEVPSQGRGHTQRGQGQEAKCLEYTGISSKRFDFGFIILKQN